MCIEIWGIKYYRNYYINKCKNWRKQKIGTAYNRLSNDKEYFFITLFRGDWVIRSMGILLRLCKNPFLTKIRDRKILSNTIKGGSNSRYVYALMYSTKQVKKFSRIILNKMHIKSCIQWYKLFLRFFSVAKVKYLQLPIMLKRIMCIIIFLSLDLQSLCDIFFKWCKFFV